LAERLRRAGRTVAQRYSVPTLDATGAVRPEEVRSAVDLLMPLARRCEDDLALFLSSLLTDAEVDALDPRAEAVTLLTLHAAKGLEFPVVFLVGCEDGLLPLRWPGQTATEEEIAEERRLFFVGLTRAQDRLYLSHVRRRVRQGVERECRPTPFLDSIDPGLLERLGPSEPRRSRDHQLRLL